MKTCFCGCGVQTLERSGVVPGHSLVEPDRDMPILPVTCDQIDRELALQAAPARRLGAAPGTANNSYHGND